MFVNNKSKKNHNFYVFNKLFNFVINYVKILIIKIKEDIIYESARIASSSWGL